MDQEKRSLLAGVLSMIVLVGWYFFFGKNMIEQSAQQAQQQAAMTQSQPQSPNNLDGVITPPAGLTQNSPTTPRQTFPESKTNRETPLVLSEWSSHGGQPKVLKLKNYTETIDAKSPPASLLGLPGEKALDVVCDGCNFQLPSDQSYRLVNDSEKTLLYEASNDEVKIQKLYEFTDDNYLLNIKITLQSIQGKGLEGRLGLAWQAKQLALPPKSTLSFLEGPGNQRAFVTNIANKISYGYLKDEKGQAQGVVPWIGLEDRYFLTAIITRKLGGEQKINQVMQNDHLRYELYSSPLSTNAQGAYEESYSVYAGPKDRSFLLTVGAGLEQAVDYGWFSFIAIPILKLLQIFHGIVGNWGVAIIFLTLLIKALMNPLTAKSMKQMKEMQKIQPKLAALKEKYKNDKQKLQIEMMALFKAHQVNPIGGCLPMLLQMPIYIALYKVIYNSIELYHAPFFGFYRDLAAPDPYFILPILLGLAMVLQQKLTPSASMDPAQKQMMMIMPIMFTGFMLFLPLGLVIYIFVNTVSGVLQQWMYQRGIRWRDLLRGKLIMEE